MSLKIQPERPNDVQAIFDLTVAAFETVPYSDGSEAKIINDLRNDADLTLSLVATLDDRVVGHIAFSPVNIETSDGQWFGLGPISVDPSHQGAGIGGKLIKQGLALIKSKRSAGCVLVGDPNYYKRFGFRSTGTLNYANIPTEYVQILPFGKETATGTIQYSRAFQGEQHTPDEL